MPGKPLWIFLIVLLVGGIIAGIIVAIVLTRKETTIDLHGCKVGEVYCNGVCCTSTTTDPLTQLCTCISCSTNNIVEGRCCPLGYTVPGSTMSTCCTDTSQTVCIESITQ